MEPFKVGSRVRVTDKYPLDTSLQGKCGTVLRAGFVYDWTVKIDGESGYDVFFSRELELV